MSLDSHQIQPAGDYCSLHSQAAGEPLVGTATRVDIWFALTYNGEWGAKALAESSLPQRVKAHLAAAESFLANARVQFIKQPGRDPDPLRLYVAHAKPGFERLYRFDLASYQDLLALDLTHIARADPAFDSYLSGERLHLVCVNGRRDKCCARFGVPVYDALAKLGGDSVWQTTHLGGHRFAPTVVFLPHGIHYGRVQPADAPALLDAYDRAELVLANLRGRSGYDASVNAAETYLRQRLGLAALGDLTLLGASTMILNTVGFEFADAQGDTHPVRVRMQQTDPIWKSCDADILEPVTVWEEFG